VAEAIATLQKKVSALLGRPGGFLAPPPPELTLSRVSGEVGGLYGLVGGADAAPTSSGVAAMADLEHEFAGVMDRWNEIKSTDLPALNRQLSAADLPEIRVRAEEQPATESEEIE